MQILQKTLLIIVVAIIIYIAFLFFSDASKIFEGLKKFDTKYLPIILIIIPISWMALFLRWHFLTKNVGIKISIKENFLIYLSGFALAITPGKFGELIKSEIMKKKFSIQRTKSAPLVIVERLYDLVGGVSVAIFGIWTLGYGAYAIIIAGVFLILIFSLLRSKKLFYKTINLLNKTKFTAKFAKSISESYETIRISIGLKILFVSSLSTMIYWMLESVGVYLIVLSFGIENLNYFDTLSIYASSLILGAASFIPGGLGVTEGSMVGLLNYKGIEASIAVIIVIIIRLFTIWYNTLIGFIALKIYGGFSLFSESSE